MSLLAHQSEGPTALTEAGLVEAARRRAATPTMTAHEVQLMGVAVELIRTLTTPAPETTARARGGGG